MNKIPGYGTAKGKNLDILTLEGETTVLNWNEVHQELSDSAPLTKRTET
jgi:hypothetical protein